MQKKLENRPVHNAASSNPERPLVRKIQYFPVWIKATLFAKVKNMSLAECQICTMIYSNKKKKKILDSNFCLFSLIVCFWPPIIAPGHQGWLWPAVACALFFSAGWGCETLGCRAWCPHFSFRAEQMEEVAEGFLGTSKGATGRDWWF